jgi:hypothetical protein
MSSNQNLTGPFLVVDRNTGETRWIEHLEEARYLGWDLYRDSEQRDRRHRILTEEFRPRFVIYDIHSRVVCHQVIAAIFEKPYISPFLRRYLPHTFRDGPVPRTGRRRWHSAFRRIKTFAERRQALGLSADIEDLFEETGHRRIKLRSRRSCNGLPTNWDDILRSDVSNRSWKNSRHTQWRE